MTINEQTVPGFLTGGGELGELIRTKDWSSTPLGPVDTWPQSLRTCVRIILTSSQPMFVWWGPDLINLYNDPYKAIVGGKHPEALGQPAKQVWAEIWNESGPRAETALSKNVGTYDEALLLIMERNGYPEETYYTFSYSPVPGDDGVPTGIICANSDDTARITGERQMRTLKDIGNNTLESKSVAETYEKTLNALSQNPQDFPFAAIYHFENDCTEARLAGKTSTDLTASMMPTFLKLNEQVPDNWGLSDICRENKAIVKENLGELFGPLPTGSFWQRSPNKVLIMPIQQAGQKLPIAALIVGLSPFQQASEKYIGFFRLVADQIASSIVNVTAYEEERKRAEALLEIDRAKTTFFSNISHEFRTPLTLMLGPLEELLNDPNQVLPEQHRANLASTHRNALRLLRLVNTLLDFSRIESDRLQASFSLVDLCQFTKDLAGSFRSAIEHAGLTYEVICETLPLPVYVDKQMWEKIVLNLLSNAFKYTLNGNITLRLTSENNHAVLTVQDTGIGIPEEELPNMFERFHRVENATGRTHEGTGIGLSLVKELVNLHYGKIKVESEKGKGSKFTVTIPMGNAHIPTGRITDTSAEAYESMLPDMYLKEVQSLTGAELSGAQPEHEAANSRKTTHILVVDDNIDMRDYIARLLQKGYRVSTAGHGQQALEEIAKDAPDLVVSDIMMPVMDGIELLHHIKNNPATAAIPVILLSARAGEEAKIEGYDIGADDYVVKPFSARELQARIKAQIKISTTRRETEQHLRNLFSHTPFPVAIFRGKDMIIELANERMLGFWNRRQEQVLHKSLVDVFPEISEQSPYLRLKEVYETRERVVESERLITYRKDEHLHNAYYNAVYEPVQDEQGNITHIIVMTQDITDLVMARQLALSSAEDLEHKITERTEELRQSNVLLTKSNHELEQFAYIASHDLQEPLRKIQVFSELLKEHLTEKDVADKYFEKISDSARRMASLIRDVLHYSRLSKTPDQLNSIDLNKVLQHVITDFDLLIEQKKAVVKISELPVIKGVRLQLQQLFANLIGNALKFADKATPEINISARPLSPEEVAQHEQLEPGQPHVKITVADNGIGFEQQYAEQIFVIFQRLNDKQTYKGTGIGLALCKKIVENHHGIITASGVPGEGATFEMIFPA
ncbi:ATP-binding protein [Chitinophaga horti]|uniref:histidine kinase n=1 Tax=Chitinophaga horti TaxID=2920382 RepID=A0ABY6IZ59_9BACT|nr:ATP-binding protein [Chitinophaga horti]UYQ91364.1 ATP-binding protein [Chitinophaga horti]